MKTSGRGALWHIALTRQAWFHVLNYFQEKDKKRIECDYKLLSYAMVFYGI
jgi:hypothetical protein